MGRGIKIYKAKSVLQKKKKPTPKWSNILNQGLIVILSLQSQTLDEMTPKTPLMENKVHPFIDEFFKNIFNNDYFNNANTEYIGSLEKTFLDRVMPPKLGVAQQLLILSKLVVYNLKEMNVDSLLVQEFCKIEEALIKELGWVKLSNPQYLALENKYKTFLKKNVI